MDPLVRELSRLPERLAALLAGQPEEVLRRPAPDGGWSIKEIAWHLTDAARIFHERLFLTASHERPQLPAYDEAALARDRDYLNLDTARLLPTLRSWRDETVDLLDGLGMAAWDHVAVHEELGEISLIQLAVHLAEHELDHLRGIQTLLGGPSPAA